MDLTTEWVCLKLYLQINTAKIQSKIWPFPFKKKNVSSHWLDLGYPCWKWDLALHKRWELAKKIGKPLRHAFSREVWQQLDVTKINFQKSGDNQKRIFSFSRLLSCQIFSLDQLLSLDNLPSIYLFPKWRSMLITLTQCVSFCYTYSNYLHANWIVPKKTLSGGCQGKMSIIFFFVPLSSSSTSSPLTLTLPTLPSVKSLHQPPSGSFTHCLITLY